MKTYYTNTSGPYKHLSDDEQIQKYNQHLYKQLNILQHVGDKTDKDPTNIKNNNYATMYFDKKHGNKLKAFCGQYNGPKGKEIRKNTYYITERPNDIDTAWCNTVNSCT